MRGVRWHGRNDGDMIRSVHFQEEIVDATYLSIAAQRSFAECCDHL